MRKAFLIAILGIIIQSCTPKVSSNLANGGLTPIDDSQEIFVIDLGGSIPNDSKLVGTLKIGDTGFSNDCGYEKVIQEAKKSARI